MTLKSIPEYEGRRNCIYKDSLGKETVGVGHLVRPSDDDLFDENGCLTDGQVDMLYKIDLGIATGAAIQSVRDYTEQPDEVQQILVNMAFNLGYRGLSSFVTFLHYISLHQYSNAAQDLTTTLWYNQVGSRSKDIVDALQSLGNN